MALPGLAQAVLDAYTDRLKNECPALVEGLYLVGSVALDDFQPHTSDIDFVAVTAYRPLPADMDALGRVHDRLRAQYPRPFFDGIYVTWGDLAGNPTQLAPGPSVHEGRLNRQDGGERNPITWHTLAQQGVCCRGPSTAALNLWTDPQNLADWTDKNLDRYWRHLVDRGERLFSRSGLAALSAWACAWTVLEVSRLHYTLATGRITSKTGAGRYALDTFPPAWQRVIEEALRIRQRSERRSLYRLPLARRRDVLAFTRMVIAAGHSLYAARQSDLPGPERRD